VDERFQATAELIVAAFGRLGVEARVGEVEGEYCPGAHSVNAGGERKLMGVGQRLVSGGVHVGGVIVVDGADRVNRILEPVYGALGLAWRPEATGAVAEESETTWDDVSEALIAEYESRHGLKPTQLDEETLTMAKRLAPEHLSPDI
jgi:lipoate-protein ligase A